MKYASILKCETETHISNTGMLANISSSSQLPGKSFNCVLGTFIQRHSVHTGHQYMQNQCVCATDKHHVYVINICIFMDNLCQHHHAYKVGLLSCQKC